MKYLISNTEYLNNFKYFNSKKGFDLTLSNLKFGYCLDIRNSKFEITSKGGVK